MGQLPHLGYKSGLAVDVPDQGDLFKSEASRITELLTHSGISILFGLLLIPAPRSDSIFLYVGDSLPLWPGLWSVLFIVAGFNLAVRVVWLKKSRNIRWSILFLVVNYALYGALFLLNFGKWIALGMTGPAPTIYPIALYFGFFALLLLHIEASKPAKKERHNGGTPVN